MFMMLKMGPKEFFLANKINNMFLFHFQHCLIVEIDTPQKRFELAYYNVIYAESNLFIMALHYQCHHLPNDQ